jgi:16S rRNA (guanine966-N2)-methyltransferase
MYRGISPCGRLRISRKKGLFNILVNRLDFEELQVLDLFSGTGHISMEFASRGSTNITSVDSNYKCVHFLRTVSDQLEMNISAVKSEVFEFLRKCNTKFDLIFADPPYDLENVAEIHELVFHERAY